MSKDMLGSLTRASVNLTQPQLKLTLDVVNRFTSKDCSVWVESVKTLLRTGSGVTRASACFKRSPRALALTNASVLYGETDIDPQNFRFDQAENIYCDTGDFSKLLKAVESKVKFSAAVGQSYFWIHNGTFAALKNALGPEGLFADAAEVCARAAEIIRENRGVLEVDHANWFCTADLVLSVRLGGRDNAACIVDIHHPGTGWADAPHGVHVFARN